MTGRIILKLAEKPYIELCAKNSGVEILETFEARDDLHIEVKFKVLQSVVNFAMYVADARRVDIERQKTRKIKEDEN